MAAEENRTIPVDDLVEEILNHHTDIHGPAVPLVLELAREGLRETMVWLLGDASREQAASLLLPGSQHLRKAYLLDRGGKQVIVPIAQCSAAELQEMAARLRHEGEAYATEAGWLQAETDVMRETGEL